MDDIVYIYIQRINLISAKGNIKLGGQQHTD